MNGNREEKSALKFLFVIATKEILKCEVKFCHSLDIGTRGKFVTKKKVTADHLKQIEEKIL